MKKHPQYELIPQVAIVTAYYKNGTTGQHGKVSGSDLYHMLRGFTYNEEFGLWYSDKGYDFAYDVKPI